MNVHLFVCVCVCMCKCIHVCIGYKTRDETFSVRSEVKGIQRRNREAMKTFVAAPY